MELIRNQLPWWHSIPFSSANEHLCVVRYTVYMPRLVGLNTGISSEPSSEMQAGFSGGEPARFILISVCPFSGWFRPSASGGSAAHY